MTVSVPTPAESRPVQGVAWMLASGISFIGVTGIVRYVGTDIPAAQSAFLRFAFGVLFMAPLLRPMFRAGFRPGSLRLFGMRGLVHTVAVMLWFYAMARIPVAEVTAIGYLNPILVTVGAALFLGEALAFRRIAAIGVAVIGALIVLRPGLREVTDGHLAQVGAAFFFAGSYLFAKRLSAVEPPTAIVGMLSVCVTIGLIPFAALVWVPVSAAQVGWMALLAGFGTLGHYCMTRAFQLAPMTVTQPVTFLQLIWATLLGAVVFHERIDPFVLLGGAIIIAAISYITWREAVVKRRLVTPAVGATKV